MWDGVGYSLHSGCANASWLNPNRQSRGTRTVDHRILLRIDKDAFVRRTNHVNLTGEQPNAIWVQNTVKLSSIVGQRVKEENQMNRYELMNTSLLQERGHGSGILGAKRKPVRTLRGGRSHSKGLTSLDANEPFQ